MTKKEQKLFERVLSMNNGDVDKIDGVYRFNNFYYATNGVMAVRTLDEPKSPMVPDEVQTSDESRRNLRRQYHSRQTNRASYQERVG